MSLLVLALCLSILAFTLVTAIGSAASTLLARSFAERVGRLPARARERAYLFARLAPAAAGLSFVALLFLPAFLLFEPEGTNERIGFKILLATGLAAAPLLWRARHAFSSWRHTRSRVGLWLANAQPLHLPGFSRCPAFSVRVPLAVVAVVGVRRPFLVVSRAVIDACTDEELAAILAHEAAHLDNRDNLKRLLMLAAPNPLASARYSLHLERAWQQAAEEAADEQAGAHRSLDLAAALIKVARLMRGTALSPATMAAFCQGGDIDRRVRRLTSAPSRVERRLLGRRGLAAGLLGALAATWGLTLQAGTLQQIHVLTEALVKYLQ